MFTFAMRFTLLTCLIFVRYASAKYIDGRGSDFTRTVEFINGFARHKYSEEAYLSDSMLQGVCAEGMETATVKMLPKPIPVFNEMSLDYHGVRVFNDLFTLTPDFNPKNVQDKTNQALEKVVWSQVKENLKLQLPKCWRRPGYCGDCQEHSEQRACEDPFHKGVPQGCEWHNDVSFHLLNEVRFSQKFVPKFEAELASKIDIYDSYEDSNSSVRVSREDLNEFSSENIDKLHVDSTIKDNLRNIQEKTDSLLTQCPINQSMDDAFPKVHTDYVNPRLSLSIEIGTGGKPEDRKAVNLITGETIYLKEMYQLWMPLVENLPVHPLAFRINKPGVSILDKEGRHYCPSDTADKDIRFWFPEYTTIGQAALFKTADVQHTSIAGHGIYDDSITAESNCRVSMEFRFWIGFGKPFRSYPDENDPAEAVQGECESDFPKYDRTTLFENDIERKIKSAEEDNRILEYLSKKSLPQNPEIPDMSERTLLPTNTSPLLLEDKPERVGFRSRRNNIVKSSIDDDGSNTYVDAYGDYSEDPVSYTQYTSGDRDYSEDPVSYTQYTSGDRMAILFMLSLMGLLLSTLTQTP